LFEERVRRLFALLHDASRAIVGLPRDWMRVLPKEAPLTTMERWEQAFAQADASDWPAGVDRSNIVLDVLRLLEKGSEAVVRAGEELLPPRSLSLWKHALADGPPDALPVTLTQLRVADGLEPASHAIWTSAVSLASSPRPYVRLLALNTGRWPRRISEDRLIPDHIIPLEELDPLPIANGDRRDFATIVAGARSVAISFSRRDVEGRLLGRSPLVGDLSETYLSRGRTPEHAASEADRLLARARVNSRTRRSPSPGSNAGAIGLKQKSPHTIPARSRRCAGTANSSTTAVQSQIAIKSSDPRRHRERRGASRRLPGYQPCPVPISDASRQEAQAKGDPDHLQWLYEGPIGRVPVSSV
jgi:hypothetical protein